MNDWTAGYVADIGYTYGYYEELNPLRASLPMLISGYAPPPRWETACELGFGQGVSTNIHAAASATQWFGTDFNPEHTAFARDMAQAGGASPQLFDESFAEFCGRSDLPEFDFIGVHGIWSWISEDNRRVLVDFLRRKLKVGGVLYISYNTLPGWSQMVPMRHLMAEHVRLMGAPGQPLAERIDAALEFAGKLLESGSAYAKSNPQLLERFAKLREQNRNYLAHEYFNRDWLPMPFAEMAQWLADAKLTFACTATYLGLVDPLNLAAEPAEFLRGVTHHEFRETVRDFLVNQQFRRDYWVRGARRRVPVDANDALRREVFVLAREPQDVAMTLAAPGSSTKVPLIETIYRPLIELLSDKKPRTLGEMEASLAGKGLGFAQLAQAILVLGSRGDVTSVQEDPLQEAARPRCESLNRWLLQKARSNGDVSVLASPVTGGGVTVSRSHQLFLADYLAGMRSAEKLAESCWKVFSLQRQVIVKEGKPLQTEQENLAYLVDDAKAFLTRQLPILRTLGVAPREEPVSRKKASGA